MRGKKITNKLQIIVQTKKKNLVRINLFYTKSKEREKKTSQRANKMIDRENDRKKAEGKKLAGSPPKRYPPSPIIALSAVVSVKSLWHQNAERLMLLFIFLPRRRGLCGTTGAVAIFAVETLSVRNGRNGLGMHRVASSSFLQELKQVSLNSLNWHQDQIKTLWYDIKTMFTHSPNNFLRLFLNKIKLN